MRRDPLTKERFLEGTRQRWFSILLALMILILLTDANSDIEAAPYLNFLTVSGSIFILGASADSLLKIKAAEKQVEHHQENEDPTTR